MKAILILIIISIAPNLISQIRGQGSPKAVKREACTIYLGGTMQGLISKHALIDLLNEYNKHCYNDSTLDFRYLIQKPFSDEEIWIPKEMYDSLRNRRGCILKVDAFYVHKEPSFKDFISWINSD